MPALIRNGAITDDDWHLVTDTESDIASLPATDKLILPLALWKQHLGSLPGQDEAEIGVWLDSHEDARELHGDLHRLSLVALNFPVFSDGRSYTNARELREQLEFSGELRAIGDVLRDQLFYMSRCGFNAFLLREDQDPDACLAALQDFHTGYQATIAEPAPLFRRR